MDSQTTTHAWHIVSHVYGTGRRGADNPPTVADMAAAARERLDYNASRSGYAPSAAELARYVLVLVRLLPPDAAPEGRVG